MNALANKLATRHTPPATPTTEELRAKEYPEELLLLMEQWAALYVKMGETAERARELAFATAEETRESIGGEQIYIPQGRFFELSQRHREIYQKWNGQNTHIICQQYDITESYLYRIVKRIRAEEQERLQGKLTFTP